MNGLAGILGHDRIVEVLSRMLERKTLPHALLFVGPEGAGRTTVANALVRTLLMEEGDLQAHPDYLSLERLTDEKTGKRKTMISVTQVRELTARLGLSSLPGSWKVVFIEDAHTLSMGAANALLKTLEEPKGNTLFLLRADTVEQLPATIASRCQVMRFGTVSTSVIEAGLKKMGYGATDATRAAAQSLGRPGRAIRFLKDSEYRAQQEAGVAQAVSFFTSSLPQRLAMVMDLIPKNELHKQDALVRTLDVWELVIRDVLLSSMNLSALQVCSSEDTQALQASLTPVQLLSVADRLREVRGVSRTSINSHLALEHIALAL